MTKAIFFDFDGTLADTARGILVTMKETFRTMGTEIPCDEDIIQTIGLPLIQALRQLGNLDNDKAKKATDTYRKLFPKYEAANVTIFPKVVKTLKELRMKDIRLAIVTSRDTFSLNLIMESRGLMPFFEERITADDRLRPKPDPNMVNVLLERMNLTPDEVLVIGDTVYDIEMGNRAMCPTAAVTYGNHDRERLGTAHPTHMIDSIEDILLLV